MVSGSHDLFEVSLHLIGVFQAAERQCCKTYDRVHPCALFYQRFLLDCTTQRLHEQAERQESEKRQLELVHALS